jgi:hypothetical protein
MSTENAEQQSAVIITGKTRAQRQPLDTLPFPSTTKATKFEGEAYSRLLERADVKEALFRLESTLTKRDSVSRKLCGGSQAVTIDDLSRWEIEFAAAKARLVEIAEQLPLLQNHPMLAV